MGEVDEAVGDRPALVVVDFQEDFCLPHGSLAVTGGREVAPVINQLMDLPFAIKIATQDWHPQDHISFASNHSPPDSKPFESTACVVNPLNPSETESVNLWPDHCIQGSFGAQLIPEFQKVKADLVLKKGQDSRVEMFSAFRDTYRKPCVSESGLAAALKDRAVTSVFVVGLATDFCVKHTAIHAAEEGFTTYVVSDGTKAVNQSETAMRSLDIQLREHGVRFINMDGQELDHVHHLAS